MKDGKYYTAFRILLKSSKSAKRAFVKLVAQTVQQEIKAVKHHLVPLSEKCRNSQSMILLVKQH